jgi:hypothetical protein
MGDGADRMRTRIRLGVARRPIPAAARAPQNFARRVRAADETNVCVSMQRLRQGALRPARGPHRSNRARDARERAHRTSISSTTPSCFSNRCTATSRRCCSSAPRWRRSRRLSTILTATRRSVFESIASRTLPYEPAQRPARDAARTKPARRVSRRRGDCRRCAQ